MPSPSKKANPKAEWLQQLAEIRPEVRVPGFWRGIAENSATWAAEVSAGPFWKEAERRLEQWRTSYRLETDAALLARAGLRQFDSKSAESIEDKLFRRCTTDKEYLQKAIEKSGPPIPQIEDLVRTRIPCRYIDGVDFLATKLFDLAAEMHLAPERRRKGSIEGYFAQHILLQQEVIYRSGGQGTIAKIVCEIQIASDMATHMWEASHPLYEDVRGDRADPEDWQWKPTDPRFLSNQLGHMIHLADGLLVQLRQVTRRQKT
jgi:ppGpp synthetase/RelA/SpoT-type nucleotidyltranferase